MAKGWIYLFMLLFLASFASASFTVQLTESSNGSDSIYTDEIATLNLTITNLGDSTDSYIIYTLDPSWIIGTDQTLLEVPAKATKTFVVSVDPTTNIDRSGMYGVGFDIKSTISSDVKSLQKDILVKSNSNRNFLPAITAFVSVGNDSVVDPRIGMPVVIRLVNNNGLDVKNLTVTLSSSLVKDAFVTSIKPNNETSKNLFYTLDPLTVPKEENLIVNVIYSGKSVYEKRLSYTVQKNQLFFTRNVSKDTKLLYQGYNVTLTNYGNVENKEKFTYNLGFLELLATKSDPMGIQTANGLDYTVSLSPGESLTISIVTDFRRPFYTSLICLVVLLLLLALYLRFRSPVVVSKNAVVIGEKDGGTSEVKVIVNVKNRSGHVVENIAILDKIPGITEIEQEFSLGTLKPRKIVRHPKKGTLILWDFPTMEPYEERVITYRIHSKIGILGHMRLPSAVVKFMTNDGRTMTYRSPKMKKDQ